MSRNIYNRALIVDQNFVGFVKDWPRPAGPRPDPGAPVRSRATLTGNDLVELFESQLIARHLDLISRELRSRDLGYYTIGSSGHEGNAVLGRLTRPTDPAFLHYRSGGFMVERYRYLPQADVIHDVLLSQMASAADPVSGGRHKIWGSRELWVLPQTSTIASHLPKSVGMAVGIRRAHKLGAELPVPRDSIVVCSFGDASANHSVALGAFNAAIRAAYQQVATPILFVCEDNGIGISVRTPGGWVEETFGNRRGLKYFKANGLDLVETHDVARQAIDWCRTQARPVFLHLEVVRMLGHAGTDVELEYLDLPEVEANEARDPLLASARIVLESGLMSAGEILERYEHIRQRTSDAAKRAGAEPSRETLTGLADEGLILPPRSACVLPRVPAGLVMDLLDPVETVDEIPPDRPDHAPDAEES